MSGLKATPLHIDGNIKPAVIGHVGAAYPTSGEVDLTDPCVVNDLVEKINKLDKDDHYDIYLKLRESKPRKFFNTNAIDTRFNILSLSGKDKKTLYDCVEMCIAAKTRKEVIRSAESEHTMRMEKLDEKLEFDMETDDNLAVNPTEVEKIQEMLKLNSA